jgi:hypothetical protein
MTLKNMPSSVDWTFKSIHLKLYNGSLRSPVNLSEQLLQIRMICSSQRKVRNASKAGYHDDTVIKTITTLIAFTSFYP